MCVYTRPGDYAALQVQNTALLEDLQAHKLVLASCRSNEQMMLDILSGLKDHVDKAAALSSNAAESWKRKQNI